MYEFIVYTLWGLASFWLWVFLFGGTIMVCVKLIKFFSRPKKGKSEDE